VVSGHVPSEERHIRRNERHPLAVPTRFRFPVFFRDVNRVEPAVVNIALPIMSDVRPREKERPYLTIKPNPMQDFFDKFFDGQKGRSGTS